MKLVRNLLQTLILVWLQINIIIVTVNQLLIAVIVAMTIFKQQENMLIPVVNGVSKRGVMFS